MPRAPSLTEQLADTRKRLEAALQERDDALMELAKERELTNALRLSFINDGEEAPPTYPTAAGLAPPPMRYVLVDRLNAGIKTALGPMHAVARALADRTLVGRRTP